ncbi:MAG: DUF342 domain-containing protein [Desulfamplus sp.]|nr:DUF342 domain-containing protein [Desulfamplus sp.]
MPEINTITGSGLIVGELAVKHGLITVTDLEKAMRICADLDNGYDAIPEYLIAQNLIQQKDCDRLFSLAKTMAVRDQDIQFGNVAIEKGFITKSMLELALDEQRTLFKNKKKYTLLGDILVEAGMLTLQQKDIILSEQHRYHSGSRGDYSVNNEQHSNSGDKSQQSFKGDSAHKNFAQSETFPSGIRLIIKGDGNAAYMIKTELFNKDMSIGQIKQLLASRNIIHGIVQDSLIQKFIESDAYLTKPFNIAQGNAPIEGQNAAVQYFFTKNRLKAGTIREDGTIDFRERGNIPQVEKGAVLAIKKSAVAGQVGKNIFNDTIKVMQTRDIMLKAGKGAVISPDKLRVIADVAGHPKLASDGTIYVYDTFVVQGDVDFNTGNIDYQGDVTVKGSIKNGFKVKANNIRADEIDGATIIAQGNVIVEQGINESKIYSQGSLSAKFIQNSTISCVGDVKTEREIVESNIECSGTCTIKGIIISSKISAKMGLYAKQIGMEKSAVCTVRVGIDSFALKTLERLEKSIEESKEKMVNFRETISSFYQDIEAAENKILRLTDIKEELEDKRMDILSAMSSMDSKAASSRKVKQMEFELNYLIKNIGETNRKLALCHDNIKSLRETIVERKEQIKDSEIQAASLINERNILVDWMEKNHGIPIIKVESQIMAGTRVYGRYAEDTIKSSINAVVIREEQVSRSVRETINKKNLGKDNESLFWKMYVTKI